MVSGLLAFSLGEKTISSEESFLIVGLSGVNGIVDESKPGRSTTSKLEFKSINSNVLSINLVLLGNVLLALSLGDVDLGSVNDLHAHLLSAKGGVVYSSLSKESYFCGFISHNNKTPGTGLGFLGVF